MDVELVPLDQCKMPTEHELVASLSEETCLSAFVDQIRRRLTDRGLIAGVVELDGTLLTEQEEDRKGTLPVGQFGKLRVEIAEVESFIRIVFRECSDLASNLLDLKEQISQDVRVGKTSEGLEGLMHFTDEFSVLLSAYRNGLTLLKSTGIAGSEDMETCEARLQAVEVALREILNGVQRMDQVLVSDALDYEFPEQLEALAAEFDKWSDRLGEASELES